LLNFGAYISIVYRETCQLEAPTSCISTLEKCNFVIPYNVKFELIRELSSGACDRKVLKKSGFYFAPWQLQIYKLYRLTSRNRPARKAGKLIFAQFDFVDLPIFLIFNRK
jgi:hypothetical protein